jgi:hypothetical protein
MSLSTAWLLVNVGMVALPVFSYPVSVDAEFRD